MEHLLRSEKCLQVCDKEEYSGVEEGREFIVQFGVEQFISALCFFKALASLGQFHVVLALGCVGLKVLERVTLAVVINQFAATLIDLFLQKRLCVKLTRCSSAANQLTLISGNCAV